MRAVTIVFSSGLTLDVETDSSLETIRKTTITSDEFIFIGDSLIRVKDISAILVSA